MKTKNIEALLCTSSNNSVAHETHLVGSLVAAAVARLEGVAACDAKLPPERHACRRLAASLHSEAAQRQSKRRGGLL